LDTKELPQEPPKIDPVQVAYRDLMNLLIENKVNADHHTLVALGYILVQTAVNLKIKKQVLMSTMKDLYRKARMEKDAEEAGMQEVSTSVQDPPMSTPLGQEATVDKPKEEDVKEG
jgi:hypothetical protein